MKFFSSKKKTGKDKPREEVKTETAIVASRASAPASPVLSLTQPIRRPRITEKASLKAESDNVYVFEVEAGASKPAIAEAIRDLYKVTPIKIGVSPIPSKRVFVRGKKGMKKGGKKTYVYVKKGEKIEII